MATRIVAVLIALGLVGFILYNNSKVNSYVPPDEPDKTPPYIDPNATGVEPDSPPEYNVEVEIRREGPQTNIYFTLSEAHGWYTDTVYVEFWYVQEDDDGEWRQIGDPISYMFHHYLPFGETIVEHTVLYDIEFPELDDWGTTENWRARVKDHGKVLAPNP